MFCRLVLLVLVTVDFTATVSVSEAHGQVLNKREQLEAQSFWDNRDWQWYEEHIPFFECPDSELTTTWYYRWELLTKHLTYGSPNSGYSFTEFIDRPFWSGAYGAISCPAGHQLYESRWLRKPRIANDYLRYWFRTPGAQPRNYSTWLADSAWAIHQVHPDERRIIDLLPDLIRNYESWEERHFVPDVGLFWQTGHDDGMEFNINSRQTRDILRGAPSFRPSFNAYMWADAVAIAEIAELAGNNDVAVRSRSKAAKLKENVQQKLWDPKREFFFPMFRDNEERDGHRVQAGTLTYQTGQFAGSPYGRELIGFVPWQFQMLDTNRGFESAWKTLMDKDAFFANFGPSTVERRDPMFQLQTWCCWWSGQSWPYATTQTLKGMAHLLQTQPEGPVSRADYIRLLTIYSNTHRMNGKPFLAEACHPDTGSFEGHNGYNHSEHYFHSGFNDLIITGLAGLRPRDDDSLEITPLAPPEWDWWALDDVAYHGHRVTILWDRDGSRYQRAKGLSVLVDGVQVYQSDSQVAALIENAVKRGNTSGELPKNGSELVPTNFVVNNDGHYFPRITASWSSVSAPAAKMYDGNYWYHQHPPNRWTSEGSPNSEEVIAVDLGTERLLTSVVAMLLDDVNIPGAKVRAPESIRLDILESGEWKSLVTESSPERLEGHRPVRLNFPPTAISRFRLILQPKPGFAVGLTEIEAWGDAALPVEIPPPPSGNLALNLKSTDPRSFPKASASHTSRFDKVESANDGITIFQPNPNNRWTSYESKSESDWLQIDFGRETEFRRVELAIFDDRGGVQSPESYEIQYQQSNSWVPVPNVVLTPSLPAGGQWNRATFPPIKSSRLRIVFRHRGEARTGISEILVWNTEE
ncbi:MAG: discoidin domain-containing protein [Planctomyces sp.]|nr:discoidin domain-containing protein [Planctomyces sp.]